MNVIDMYKKIISSILMLLVIVRPEEISVNNVTPANLLSLRLSTIVPYLSLHNDQNFTKDNAKRPLFLIMLPSQTRDEYKKPKEMVQKVKRCGTLSRKNKFLSLSRKEENTIRTEMKTGSLNRNIKLPRQNSNACTLSKNVKYLQETPVNKMKVETYKDNTFLRALKNNMNAENVILNLESPETKKKCNTENCICYCKEENCFSKSSMKNSSEILSSSRKDKLEKINHQRAKDENTKSNVLHQSSPKLYHKSLQELRVPNLINSFPTFYQERIHPMNIPHTPILYEKTPNILPYIIRNEKKFDNIPFPSFENRPNFLLKSNAYKPYQSIFHRNLHPCPRTIEENRVGSPISTTSSSTSYIGATIRQQTESDLESIEVTRKDEKHFFQLTTETPNNFVSINSEMETNFYPSYLDNKTEESSIIDFSNLDEIIYKLKNSTEKTKENQEDDFFKLMPFFTNYVDRSRTPSIIYPSIMQNEKFINMEECIKLFDRDVCVLSATSPEILAKQIPENNINEYSTIRIPEYIMQMSTKEITTNNVDYWDKFKTIDTYVESKSSTSGIKTSNVDLNEYLESTNTELNTDANEKFPQEFYQYEESITQTYEPNNDNYDDKLFNIKEDTNIPMKKLMDQTTDKTMEIARNTLLGKSKSHVKPLLNPNNKEALNPSSSEKYLYTNSYNNDKELNNLKTDQQTLATLADININSWSTLGVLWNTLRKEESTTTMYDLKTEYNFEEENKNYLKESNMNYYPDDEISQEQFEEEDTTINYNNLKIKHNFKEEITNKLSESKINTSHEKEILEGQSEEISTISYESKAIYNSEEENMYDLEKLNISFNPEKEILQEQFEEKIIPISSDFNTEYSFEETTENDLLGETVYLGNEILQKQPITQYLNHEKTNYLNNKEDITNRSGTIIDSSSKILPYCDNTLLLNSIRKVINDFHTLNISLTETKDLDKNVLQIQDKSLLPEILQIPNLQSILSILQTENTIVEKVKDDLTDITVIPTRNFTSDRSPDVIKNSFHSILQTLSANFHQKLPSITIEEHQFKNEQWTISPITLASVPDSKLSIANPVNLEKSRNPLNSSTIASQTDQYIRNMIVQSIKNSLTKDEHKDINNSIIHVLNNILQILKDSEDTNMLKKNNRFVGNTNVNLTFPQEISANNDEERINIDNSTNKLNVHIPKNTKIDNEKMQMMTYQEPKALENNASMIVSNFSDSTENEKDKSTDIKEKTPKETISKTEENVGNQRIQKIDTQNNEETELAESLKTTVTTYHKVISQNNLSISAIPVESNLMKAGELNKKDKNVFLETTTISSIITKNFDETEKDIITLTPRIKDANVNNDDNKSSTNDYSLNNQVLKYIQNYRINEENIQITTMPTNFIERTSSNYNVQISNDIISENVREAELPDNIISSTDVKYRNEKSKIASSTDEINPEIILERIEHNLSPIKYYSPEILKYIKNHHNADAFISFEQETLSDHAQMSDSIISQNITSAKNVGDELESILNEKTSTISTDNVISPLNVDYGNYEVNITPSTDSNVLDSQQQDFMTKDNIIAKIHETTTEVQQTYAKTTYFKSSPDNKPRINLSSSAYKANENNNNDNKDKNSSNDNDNLIGKMYNDDIITETNNVTTHISALEKSQLYYISDNMKLPLEIRKLEDGSYVLSITKNICEQRKILERKCSCCVPLQEHVTLSWNQNQDQSQGGMYGNNDKRDYYLTELPNMLTMTTGNNILKMQKLEEEKGKISAHYHCTQNLNDNNLITILMPIIDCTKKYNLFLDFNKVKKMPFNETESYDIIQNYDKLLIELIKKFEYDKLEEKNFNNNFETKENEFASKSKDATDELQNSVNFRERKDTMSTNFSKSSRDFYDLENSIEIESRNKNAKADQYEIIKDLHKFETEKNIQNTNIERIINSKSQKRNPLFRSIDISKEDTKINNKEVKSDKHRIVNIKKGNVKVLEKKKERKPQQIIEYENQERIPSSRIINSGDNVNMESEETSRDKLTNNKKGNVFYKREKKEHKIRMIDNKQNDSRIKIFEGDNKKPYRYQRNTSGILNKRAELMKSILYWLKSLFK